MDNRNIKISQDQYEQLIRNLSNWLSHLNQLRSLCLEENQLILLLELPIQLRYLYLKDNQLSYLPELSTQLRILDLSNN